MNLMIAGLVLWTLAHFFKRLAPNSRAALNTKIGEGPANGVMSLLIIASVGMMVIGFPEAPVETVYEVPSWGKPVNNLWMLVAVALMGMGSSKGRARALWRHPMLTGLVVWSAAHLLVNGDKASVILFTVLALWALAQMSLINMREGAWTRPEPGPVSGDIKWLVISAVVFIVIAGLHIWIGPSPFGV